MIDPQQRDPAPTAVFRLEWGQSTGWGHLVRCAALASELQARDWHCVLWTRGSHVSLPEELRSPFASCEPVDSANPDTPPEIARTAAWLIVDDYSFDDGALRRLRARCDRGSGAPAPRLLVIDDEARRYLEAADLALNTRLGLHESPYAPRVCALTGEAYALLRPGLRTPDPIGAGFFVGVEPVLVMLGGTDAADLTPSTLEALAEVPGQRFAPILVRARRDADGSSVHSLLAGFPASACLESIDASTLAAWARVCRLAVSAAGGALYEFAFLGLPFVALVVADNQRAFAVEVERRWRMPVLDGRTPGLRPALAGAVSSLLTRPPGWGPTPRDVDGCGAARVADVLCEMIAADQTPRSPAAGISKRS